jgi:hypothetical protein
MSNDVLSETFESKMDEFFTSKVKQYEPPIRNHSWSQGKIGERLLTVGKRPLPLPESGSNSK